LSWFDPVLYHHIVVDQHYSSIVIFQLKNVVTGHGRFDEASPDNAKIVLVDIIVGFFVVPLEIHFVV